MKITNPLYRYYQIFYHDTYPPEAVKYGFSYPGFFFVWIWALRKGMYRIFILTLLVGLLPSLIIPMLGIAGLSRIQDVILLTPFPFSLLHISFWFLPLLVPLDETAIAKNIDFVVMLNLFAWGLKIFYGFYGNKLRVIALKNKAYENTKIFIFAGNAKQALLFYRNEMNQIKKIPLHYLVWRWGIILSLLYLWIYLGCR